MNDEVEPEMNENIDELVADWQQDVDPEVLSDIVTDVVKYIDEQIMAGREVFEILDEIENSIMVNTNPIVSEEKYVKGEMPNEHPFMNMVMQGPEQNMMQV